jgi:two-component system, cell cycle response regulator
VATDAPGDYESLYRSYLAALKQVDHLSTLREIGLAINATLELDDALRQIAEVVQGALDVGRLTIYLPDAGGATAHPVIAKYGRDLITKDRLEEERVAVAGSHLGDAIKSRQVIIDTSPIETAAYVPLIAKNVAVGVMVLEDFREGEPFSDEERELFQSIGAQIAVAIHNALLYAMAVTDGLTGLYVRRYFDLRMQEEFEQARRYQRSFSLLLFDIDHFKQFNDTHGHQTGDAVLQQFAKLLADNTRKSDICCRYGGEEMAVILPETRLEEAIVLANKLCLRVRNRTFAGTEGKGLSVTTSVGVAEYTDDYASPDDMIRDADEALYTAKENGRDRVESA